jgi:hypothetical protein
MDNDLLVSAVGTVAFVLLVAVSAGIVYLTASGWRDRRRREADRRQS